MTCNIGHKTVEYYEIWTKFTIVFSDKTGKTGKKKKKQTKAHNNYLPIYTKYTYMHEKNLNIFVKNIHFIIIVCYNLLIGLHLFKLIEKSRLHK